MITGIAAGRFVVVQGGLAFNSPITKSYSHGSHLSGSVMYDLNEQCLKVYDGITWVNLNSSYATVELDNEAVVLLEWAREKRQEEIERNLLSETHPTIKILMDQIKEKEEQIRLVQTLVKNEFKPGTN